MIVLDTDTLSIVLRDDSEAALRVRARIAQLPRSEKAAVTIVTYQEQTRGWLSYLAKARGKPELIYAYSLLAKHLDDFREARVIPFGQEAADLFDRIRTTHPRHGTMDLRIAAIVLVNNATLITRNLRDFHGIEGLRVEDWTKN